MMFPPSWRLLTLGGENLRLHTLDRAPRQLDSEDLTRPEHFLFPTVTNPKHLALFH